MKVSKNKEINEKILAIIIVLSCLIFFFLGFGLFESAFYILIILWITYLLCPIKDNKRYDANLELLMKQSKLKQQKNKRSQSDNTANTANSKQALQPSYKKLLLKRWEDFGEKSALCPSCGVELEKFPKRKIKCKKCKKTIYRGKNYFTNELLLYAAKNEKLYIELLWLSDGTWKMWFDNYSEILKIKKTLAKKYEYDGHADNIPLRDAIWCKIQTQLLNTFNNQDWNAYKTELESAIRFSNDVDHKLPDLSYIYEFIYLSYIVSFLSDTDYEEHDLFSKQMSIGGLSLILTIIKDFSNFDESYLQTIKNSALFAVIKEDPVISLAKFKKQKAIFQNNISK